MERVKFKIRDWIASTKHAIDQNTYTKFLKRNDGAIVLPAELPIIVNNQEDRLALMQGIKKNWGYINGIIKDYNHLMDFLGAIHEHDAFRGVAEDMVKDLLDFLKTQFKGELYLVMQENKFLDMNARICFYNRYKKPIQEYRKDTSKPKKNDGRYSRDAFDK